MPDDDENCSFLCAAILADPQLVYTVYERC